MGIMPSQITHALFALEAYRRAIDSSTHADNDKLLPWIIQGSLGPDPLFSSIRREPCAQIWAFRMHAEGFGRVAASIAVSARESGENGAPDAEQIKAFATGFCSHAVLDRKTHPLVNFFSGWVNPEKPATGYYQFCHPFMERIIDMIILRDQLGTDLPSYRYPARILPLRDQEAILPPLYARAIQEAYPEEPASRDSFLEDSLVNALRDDSDFLALICPSDNTVDYEAAVEAENRGELPERILGLFYPENIPPGDFMNEDRALWIDPRRGGDKRKESFMDLYHEALDDAVRIMKLASEVIDGHADPEMLEGVLGNGDLNDTSPGGSELPFQYCKPLEISPLIDGMYARAWIGGLKGDTLNSV